MSESSISERIKRTDAWLESMRGVDGYGGPVAHIWQNCLYFTGAGLDWRYEGITHGYLALHNKTGAEQWLVKACRAADDLLHGQQCSGNFKNSSFELNPYSRGTPHEAACDLALLTLADVLRTKNLSNWRNYFDAAERNLRAFYIGCLWNEDNGFFGDAPKGASFVPNKAATLVEALFKIAEITGDDAFVEQYALPTLHAVVAHQVCDGLLDGAIDQYSVGGRPAGRYFPYYNGRCLTALLLAFKWTSEERFLDAALRAAGFILRYRRSDGSFAQVVYRDGRVSHYPTWTAGLGDVLRALLMVREFGVEVELQCTHERLMKGQQPTGSFMTATGFSSQASNQRLPNLPDFRDVLPVCGWTDKAFRYLATILSSAESIQLSTNDPLFNSSQIAPFETWCSLGNDRLRYFEDSKEIKLTDGAYCLYEWQKGQPWANIQDRRLLWK